MTGVTLPPLEALQGLAKIIKRDRVVGESDVQWEPPRLIDGNWLVSWREGADAGTMAWGAWGWAPLHDACIMSSFTFGRAAASAYYGRCDCGWRGPNHRTSEKARADMERHATKALASTTITPRRPSHERHP